jgi:hypothetical protein
MTSGAPLLVERVRVKDTDLVVEGCFELPPLASLTAEDQIFIAAFIQAHGSIKRMEQIFGVSYPTIKNRLRALCEVLNFVDISEPDLFDRRIAMGKGALTGRRAQVREKLDPTGAVYLDGALWIAVSDAGPIDKGEEVLVIGELSNMRLKVRRAADMRPQNCTPADAEAEAD